jgi:hypothetical protein
LRKRLDVANTRMSFLRILKDTSNLEGTAYIELLPGKYKGQCWNRNSLFFDEATFGLFEKIVERNVPDYDHYAFTEVSGTRWQSIIARLKSLSVELGRAKTPADIPVDIHFYFKDTEQQFNKDIEVNLRLLMQISIELSNWLEATLKHNEEVTILGL